MALFQNAILGDGSGAPKSYFFHKLLDLCINCIVRNFAVVSKSCTHLPASARQKIFQRMADHDFLEEPILPLVFSSKLFVNLKQITFSYSPLINDSFMKKFCKSSLQLEHIKIMGCKELKEAGLCEFFVHQTHLIEIVLKELPAFTPKALSKVKSPLLKSLKIQRCHLISSKSVCLMTKANPSIESLCITNCIAVSHDIFPPVAENLSRNLIELDLSFLHVLNDESLENISNYCPNLQLLNMYGPTEVTHVGIEKLVTRCLALRVLDLSYCQKLTLPSHFECMYKLPVSIQELSLCGMQFPSSSIIVNILSRLINLRGLRLSGVLALTDDLILQVLERIGWHLEYLDLSGSVMSNLSDKTIEFVVRHCPKIRLLGINLLKTVIMDPFEALLKVDERAQLITSLSLNKVQMEPSLLNMIAKKCINLTYLDIAEVSAADDDFLMIVSENCCHLSCINIKGCREVTDRGVCKLAIGCPLVSLCMAGTHITDRSIFTLANACSFLTEIYLLGCRKVSTPAVNYLIDCCLGRLFVSHRTNLDNRNAIHAYNIDDDQYVLIHEGSDHEII